MSMTKKRTTRKSSQSAPDAFTRLCASELRVECVREYRFYNKRRWRFDYAIPTLKIALEVEGGVWTQGRHTRPKGFLNDITKYNTAALFGWRVFRCTPSTLMTRQTLHLIKCAISGAMLPAIEEKGENSI